MNVKELRIAYIGSYAKGTIHQMFDTCFLHVCSLLVKSIDCYKDPSTFQYIEESAKKYQTFSNVNFHKIRVWASRNKYLDALGEVLCAIENLYLYFLAWKDDVLIYNYNNIYSLHLLNVINKLFKKKVIIVCHGELELLTVKASGKLAKIKKEILNNFFRGHANVSLSFIVLGNSILHNLEDVLNCIILKSFYSMDHPYYFPDVNNNLHNNDILKIGLVGTLSVSKGLNSFIEFVEKISASNVEFQISIIGRIDTHMYDDFFQKHNIKITWGYLSREDFNRRVQEMDFLLYFYPSTSYKLIASGAVFDAIAMKKPILAIKNDFFDYVIKKANYPAMLFESVDEMVEAVSTGKVFNLQKKEYENPANVFSPEIVSKRFQEIIYQIMEKKV